MMALSFEAWQVLIVIGFCFSLLVFSRLPADAILIGGVVLLVLADIITPSEALIGMSNEGMVTVGVLFVVAQGLVKTGVVSWISQNLLGRPKNNSEAQLRLMLPVAGFSSILNNTPVVAMLVPAVTDWAKRNNLSVSQLMIPLSYAAIIGGTCTLVGTSTNLVINGMIKDSMNSVGLGMFDLAWVGIPCVLIVIAFTISFSRWLLPNKEHDAERFKDAREYIVEMEVEEDSPLIGLSIEEAGLRHLPGMFLVEINRDGRLLIAVAPSEVLYPNDRLVLAGDVRSIVDLKNIRGLKVAEEQVFKLTDNPIARRLVEVVVSPAFPHRGKTVKEMGFRKEYGAVIIAVARSGQQIKVKIGDIKLKPGDTLLLETQNNFVAQQRYSKDFLLVSKVENSEPVRHERRNISVLILLAMVFSVSFGYLSMLKAAMLASGLMIFTRCINVQEVRRSVDWQVLLVIAASIALGNALAKTGAATIIAQNMVGLSEGSPLGALIMLFILTSVFSAMISNLAAAVLLFPVAVASSQQLGVDLMPFAVTLMIAASTCFSTPIGYQTNLMVFGPGNYHFNDYMKIGLPLTFLVGVMVVLIVPVVWPF